MTQFIGASSGGPGINVSLTIDENAILADGTQIWSDNNTTLFGAQNNSVVLSPVSGVISFAQDITFIINGNFNSVPVAAIEFFLGGDLLVADGAFVRAEEDGVRSGDELEATNEGSITGKGYGIFVVGGLELVNTGLIQGGEGAVEASLRSRVVNRGDIVHTDSGTATGSAIRLLDGGDVENSGRLTGRVGVWAVEGPLDLDNSGVITADTGVRTNDGDDVFFINNSGSIVGASTAISVFGIGGVIVNEGSISTGVGGFSLPVISLATDSLDASHRIINSGDILASGPAPGQAGLAVRGDIGADRIENLGLIRGDVDLDRGDDLYLGRNGRIEGSVSGGDGEDVLVGGAEENVFLGGAKNDVLRGRGGDDELSGEGGADLINGGAGDDVIRGGFSADRLLGKAGDDEIYGDEDPDRMFGGKGDDLLYGGAFSDQLSGGAGDDTLGGGNGFDTLAGGRGDDQLSGGAASDTFVMKRRSDDDLITDFQNGMDKIDLSAFGLRPSDFAAVVAPALSDADTSATFLDLTQLGGNGSLLIQGLALGQADVSDFIL